MDKKIECTEHELSEAITAEAAEILRDWPETDQSFLEWQCAQIVGGVLLRLRQASQPK